MQLLCHHPIILRSIRPIPASQAPYTFARGRPAHRHPSNSRLKPGVNHIQSLPGLGYFQLHTYRRKALRLYNATIKFYRWISTFISASYKMQKRRFGNRSTPPPFPTKSRRGLLYSRPAGRLYPMPHAPCPMRHANPAGAASPLQGVGSQILPAKKNPRWWTAGLWSIFNLHSCIENIVTDDQKRPSRCKRGGTEIAIPRSAGELLRSQSLKTPEQKHSTIYAISNPVLLTKSIKGELSLS